ncbi:polysaccharide deacetylase family sporulation protein PdaB [Fontibacillus panacisegetis]|uniref:Polysaccharide deacetylase family sporulation protein PdaB n=1 Tax=Fontibacillus panacisegetis TaxID=670482 RepID=A0A1G7GHV5_9BACL|nr:polysaccharide deacetylase family protein [Fontibacillus panacisegetis]SDE87599.1 polysaccharide deacetylase family sporulation protein PdaB [Fontibacillus panacisegetis]
MSNKIMRLRLLVTTLVIILITLVTCHATVQAHHKPVTEDMATETSNSVEEPLSLGELRKKYSETFKFRGPEVKQIALTFDDVPDPRFTPKVLEILRKQGVKATFFVVGSRAQKHPDLLRQIHQNGHLIGNHSYSHPQFKNRSVKQFQNEIQRTEKIIQRTIGYRPKLIRPPYGEINEGQVKWAKLNGYKIINWNVDSLDWKGLGKEKVKANILNAVGPGSIVLQHAGGGVGSNLSGSIDALPDVIQSLRAKGYHFVTLDELLHTKKYK